MTLRLMNVNSFFGSQEYFHSVVQNCAVVKFLWGSDAEKTNSARTKLFCPLY